jgi:lycopene cyclase domain-containing protein
VTHWSYLPFLLVWALPVIVVQWLVGGRYLWRERGVWPWIVLGLCIYFSLVDAVAIKAGIWHFDTTSLVGLWLGPAPIEEVLFYLLTTTMIVQGFVIIWRSKRS